MNTPVTYKHLGTLLSLLTVIFFLYWLHQIAYQEGYVEGFSAGSCSLQITGGATQSELFFRPMKKITN